MALGWFWQETAKAEVCGPFESEREAQLDCEAKLFGRAVMVVDGGSLGRQPGERLN